MPRHSAEIIIAFRDLCDKALQSWQLRKLLFDENPDYYQLKAPHYAHFFLRLQIIIQDHWILQIAKLHDPPQSLGKDNLSIDYMIERGQWDASTKNELIALRNKMTSVLATTLKSPRNKLICHNDLETILQKHDDLGKFNRGADAEYVKHLCEFASIVCERVLGEQFFYDDHVSNDVDIFMAAFSRGRVGS
jgi:hypothetical protein